MVTYIDSRYSMIAMRSSGDSSGPITPLPRGPSLNSWPASFTGPLDRQAQASFSRNSRLARAFAIVSWSVAPTAVPSTMIGPLKPNDFSFANSAGEIDLAAAELDHHLVAARVRVRGAEWRRAHFTLEKMRTGTILCDDAGHIGADDLERRNRILPRVIDHVSRVEEDAEVRMIDLPHPSDELTGRCC